MNNLLPDSQASAPLEEQIAKVTQDWGMTRAEAERVALARPSYVCVLLEHEGTKIGTFYMDGTEAMLFSPSRAVTRGMAEGTSEQQIADRIQREANHRLAKKVAKLLDDLSAVSLHIDIASTSA